MLYKIANQNFTVTIDSLGAEIKSIQYRGTEFMHDSNPKYWGRSAPYLFPNIGTIKDKFTIFSGKEYPLTKHGFLRDIEMDCVSVTDDQITFVVGASDKTKALYPFDFQVVVHYELSETSVNAFIEVINNGSNALPFNFGLHPAFKVPWNEGEKFEDYTISFTKPVTCDLPSVILTNGLVDWENPARSVRNLASFNLNHLDFAGDALVFDKIDLSEVKLSSPKGDSVTLKSKGFKTLGIWSPYPVEAPFVCLEPWIGCADAPKSNHEFLTKKDLIILKPNEKWQTNYQIIIKKD